MPRKKASAIWTDTLADAVEKGGGIVSGARVAWVSGVDLFSDTFAGREISKYVYAFSYFRGVILILSKECEIWQHIVCA